MVVIIQTSSDKRNVIEDICREVLSKRLAAAANIDAIDSLFWWNGAMISRKEYRVSLKTIGKAFKEIEKVVISLHNYETPQLISLQVSECNSEYQAWIEEQVIVK